MKWRLFGRLAISVEWHGVKYETNQILQSHGVIPAVKFYRDKTKCGLRDAVIFVKSLKGLKPDEPFPPKERMS